MVTNPGGTIAEQFHNAPSAAYFFGEQSADLTQQAPGLIFRGAEAITSRGAEAIATPGGVPTRMLEGWDPVGGLPAQQFTTMFGTPAARIWPDNAGFPLGYTPSQPVGLLTNDGINNFVDDDGRHHYLFYERGQLQFDRVGNLDDVLYWFADEKVELISGRWAAEHNPPNQDQRIIRFQRQYEILSGVHPEWGKRWVREAAEELRQYGKPQDISMFPSIGEEL